MHISHLSTNGRHHAGSKSKASTVVVPDPRYASVSDSAIDGEIAHLRVRAQILRFFNTLIDSGSTGATVVIDNKKESSDSIVADDGSRLQELPPLRALIRHIRIAVDTPLRANLINGKFEFATDRFAADINVSSVYSGTNFVLNLKIDRTLKSG